MFFEKRKRRAIITLAFMTLLASVCFAGCGGEKVDAEDAEYEDYDFTVSYDGIETGTINARVSIHDPSIIVVNGLYYIFGSHMTAAVSEDLRSWTNIANGYTTTNALYTDLWSEYSNSDEFEWAGAADSITTTDDGGTHVWAPDVIYLESTGLYYMYYCTTSNYYVSNLCYATSETIDGPYVWQGALLYSGFNTTNIDSTDVLDYVTLDYAKDTYLTLAGTYDNTVAPNCIDPSVFFDEDGRLWMVYGSWSGGIYLIELDTETGLVIHPETDEENDVDAYFGKRLIGGGHKSIEGPYIEYSEETGYYYLYVSYGSLTSSGGYQIRVFRSETVDGDYVDMKDRSPESSNNHAYFGLKLSGNYYLPSLNKAYMATGGNSAFVDTDGKTYLCYHARFNDGTESHSPRVKQYFYNEEGWPCLLPYATNGETISETGYDTEDVIGEYYVVNQGTDISSDIAEPFMLVLTAKGNVYGDGIKGSWSMTDGTYYMHITIDDVEYSGVFCEMTDEAGTDVMVFTAVGANESLWGVKYE